MTISPEMKPLSQLAHQARQFDRIYFGVFSCSYSPSPFVSHSPRTTADDLPAPSYDVSRVVRPRVCKEAADHNVLNRLASDVLQFGFVYPTLNIPVGPRPHEFLVRRASPALVQREQKEDIASLTELNRLARLVELSHGQAELYPSFTPAYSFLTIPKKRLSFDTVDMVTFKLRIHLRLDDKSSFEQCFPATRRPRVTMSLGSPSIDRSVFNHLLASKLASARSWFKTPHTPKGVPSLVTSWINKLLCRSFAPRVPNPATKKSNKKISPSKTEKPISFVPPQESEAVVSTSATVPSDPVETLAPMPIPSVFDMPLTISMPPGRSNREKLASDPVTCLTLMPSVIESSDSEHPDRRRREIKFACHALLARLRMFPESGSSLTKPIYDDVTETFSSVEFHDTPVNRLVLRLVQLLLVEDPALVSILPDPSKASETNTAFTAYLVNLTSYVSSFLLF